MPTAVTVGASHRTATAAMLGHFDRAADAFRVSVSDGVHRPTGVPVHELAVLSTCARVEVYAVTEDAAADEATRVVGSEVFGADGDAPGPAYRLRGHDVVRHACRVAAGLDSFVVGEHEIAGQLQRALRGAARMRVDGRVLEDVAALAKLAGRRVRAETGIGRYPASVSSVAVDLVRERLGDLGARRALVVGAGKAGLLVARALRRSGVAALTVVNRSADRARRVADEVGGVAAGLGRLPDLLADADVVLSATGAEGIVVDVATARDALAVRRSGRAPLLLLDLALPGDVDPRVGALEGVELLTLEDVKARVHDHIALRRDELGAAERVVDEVVDDFVRQQDAPDVDRLVGALRRSIEEIRSAEVSRFLERRDPTAPTSRDELDQLTRSIVNKLLHDPTRRLRAAPERGAAGRLLVGAARELAGLDTQRDHRGGPRG